MEIIRIDSVKSTPSGKSLIIKSGDATYFAKPASGLSAGMTIEAETKESEFNGKINVWIDKWKDAPKGAAPSAQTSAPAGGDVMRYMPFVSNTVAHAISAGLVKEPHEVTAWAHAAATAAKELEDYPF